MTDEYFEKIIPYIWGIEAGQWILPGELNEKFDILMNDVSMILATLAEIGVVKIHYLSLCDDCREPIGEPFEFISDFIDNVKCPKCGKTIERDTSIVIFKKSGETEPGTPYEPIDDPSIEKQFAELAMLGAELSDIFH